MSRPLLLALFALLTLARPLSAADESRLQKARRFLDAGRPDAARLEAEAALRRTPGNAPALILHGRASEALGNDEAALADYGGALKAKPGMTEALARRGLLRIRLMEAKAGLEDVEKVLKTEKDHPIALKAKGMALFYLRQRIHALGALDRAVVAGPADWEAWFYRAIVRLYRRPVTRRRRPAVAESRPTLADVNRSVADLAAAIAAGPREVLPYEYRGDLYLNVLDKPALARKDYDRAIELRPDRPAPHFQRGLARLTLGDLDGSITDFNRFLSLVPESTLAPYNIACAHARAGRADEALCWLEKAVVAGFLDEIGNLDHIAVDPDLTSLRHLPRFRRLRRANRAD
jgi:tetratricopeptide (TPR) repeat protein